MLCCRVNSSTSGNLALSMRCSTAVGGAFALATRAASKAVKKRVKVLKERLAGLETQRAAVDARLDGWQRALVDAQTSYRESLERLRVKLRP